MLHSVFVTMAATNNIIVLLLLFLAGGRHELLVAALGSNDVVHIRYGYFDNALPIHAACGRGWLNLAKNVQEDTPEYIVECFPQSSGSVAASRLDNAQLDIASLGSTPWAQAVARGLPLEEIYISVVLESTEGIYVRNGDAEIGYVGINSPSDLVNRTIGVPFGSTTHYQTLFLVDLFDLRGLVKVVHLSPTEVSFCAQDVHTKISLSYVSYSHIYLIFACTISNYSKSIIDYQSLERKDNRWCSMLG